MPGVRLGPYRRRYRAISGLLPLHGRLLAGVERWCAALSGAGADEVRHVGDAVAFVVADTLDQARDAAEAIEHRMGGAAACRRRGEAAVAGAPLRCGPTGRQPRLR